MSSQLQQTFDFFMNNYNGRQIGVTTEVFKEMLKKCKRNKSKTCRHTIGTQLNPTKIYMDNYESLYFKEFRDNNELTFITDGEVECIDCGFYNRVDMYEWEDELVCKDCLFKFQKDEKERKLQLEKEKISVFKISSWFLECKYNPQYKYCRDRLNKLYDEEFN